MCVRYRLLRGARQPASRKLPNECAPRRQPLSHAGAVAAAAVHGGGRGPVGGGENAAGDSCAQVLISLPEARQHGFRALHALLKRRAFRAESHLITWR